MKLNIHGKTLTTDLILMKTHSNSLSDVKNLSLPCHDLDDL